MTKIYTLDTSKMPKETKIKFVVKPPIKKDYQREFSIFKKEFEGNAEEEFTEKEGPQTAKNLAKKAIEESFNKIIFVGGDGLLNEGINGIFEATQEKIPSDFAIGIIPTGSGNNFAKEIGIPKDIKKAFEIIKEGKLKSVDIGKVNERFFVNVVSFGFDAKVNKLANKIKEKYQFLPKDISYLIAALKEIIIKIPLYEVELRGGEINLKDKVVLVAVTNGSSYGAIFKINPGADPADGLLNVCLIQAVGKIRALIAIQKVIKGTHTTLPEVKLFKTSSLTISSPTPLPYETDGEVLAPEREYRISVLPKTLKILVP